MRKIFLVICIIGLISGAALSQQQQQSVLSGNMDDAIPNMGRAPKVPNGIGRLDLRVVDENGNPVKGVRAKLESMRTDGYFCESWSSTNDQGVAVLPPLHMGRLKLILKASGFHTHKVGVPASSLSEPVRITMIRKK